MDANLARGKNTLLGILGAVLGISFLSTIINIFSGGNIVTDLVRFALSCLLCYFLYKGKNWAKWVMVVLMIISAVLGLIGALSIIISFLLGIMSLALGIIYGVAAVLLLTSNDIKAFLDYQRSVG